MPVVQTLDQFYHPFTSIIQIIYKYFFFLFCFFLLISTFAESWKWVQIGKHENRIFLMDRSSKTAIGYLSLSFIRILHNFCIVHKINNFFLVDRTVTTTICEKDIFGMVKCVLCHTQRPPNDMRMTVLGKFS